ncbi:iron chaperone [Ornithinibacillus sp. 4-3]|uniref:Iron chaperone n=1 Tax=Ornithinibacillus sp. 4-3 TaxID=3231488 RepID=A0AB39HR62_9BACI
MFTNNGTFIIGFNAAKKHFAVAPEPATIKHFMDEIVANEYSYTTSLVRFPWDQPVNYHLISQFIEFNIKDKATNKTFWRYSK